ncbi:MAG: sugar isomerase domain-containing protein [Oscillospiraceae bacterium]|nr:sugar isomerase domain-containing protein [Oscillospiraceae bacterium]
MTLLERYREAVDDLFRKVRETQTENIVKAGEMVADSVADGGCIFLSRICHSMEMDSIYRGGGPIFYRHFSYDLKVENTARPRDRSDLGWEDRGAAARYALTQSNVRPGDVLFLSSVSGRTVPVVDLAWEAVKLGIKVVAFTSMEYAVRVEPVHPSGKKLYEIATLTLDNCAPAAEAMLDVEGIEARFGAASGIASDYIMWSVTSVAVEKLMEKGVTPGILKSANFPGGNDYNKTVVEPNYEKFGW